MNGRTWKHYDFDRLCLKISADTRGHGNNYHSFLAAWAEGYMIRRVPKSIGNYWLGLRDSFKDCINVQIT